VNEGFHSLRKCIYLRKIYVTVNRSKNQAKNYPFNGKIDDQKIDQDSSVTNVPEWLRYYGTTLRISIRINTTT